MLYIVYSFPHIAQSDVAGVRLQVHEEQQDPVPAPGRGQVHLPGPHPCPGHGTLHHLLIRNRQRLGV